MNEFINGECLEEMKKMPDESIDFILLHRHTLIKSKIMELLG